MPDALNPWYGKAAVLAATIVMIAIRAPHGQRSRSMKVVKDRKGRLEVGLLWLAMIGFVLPLIWIASPWLAFADYPLHPASYVAGVVLLAASLWLFFLSHRDLGPYWSITLQVREAHQLITRGVYRRIRHPMYASLFLYSIGQWLVLPNWVAGPAYLVTFGILYAMRVRAEERMMVETFGDAYVDYMGRTRRLVPGVW